MDYKDYYSILGVSKDIDAAELKKEYRKLARKYHPDVNKDAGADHTFKEIGEAYEVLKDPEKRKAYDQYGENWKAGAQQQEQRQQYQNTNAGGQHGGGFDFGGDFSGGGGDYSDFFESMFGGGQQRGSGGFGGFGGHQPRKQKGQYDDASISIPLEEAYTGTTRTVTFESPELTPNGTVEHKRKTLKIKVPKGIKKGGKIRLKGQGGPGHNGGEPGDMYITIDINAHRIFTIDGSDIFLTLPIAPWEAALGAKVDVPTPGGTIKLTIPENATSGKKLKLKGKGIPSKSSGDLFVELQIVLPPAESDEAKRVESRVAPLLRRLFSCGKLSALSLGAIRGTKTGDQEAVCGRDPIPDQSIDCLQNCRPEEAGTPNECFWPVDVLELENEKAPSSNGKMDRKAQKAMAAARSFMFSVVDLTAAIHRVFSSCPILFQNPAINFLE